jgi:type I restriction-modification system DNA methylase subunit
MGQNRDEMLSQLRSLVLAYQTNRTEYTNPKYGETSVRVEFINPLFCLLGWDVNNEAGLSIYGREVIHEASVKVDDEDEAHANKKPDYAFRIGGETKFFLEAKKPSVDLVSNPSPAFQARRYGWNGNHAIAVLSNFEDLAIYDCGYRPIEGQPASFARIACYHYSDYVAKFDEIASILSKERVAKGSLDVIDAREQAVKMPFDDMFLAQINSWRGDIAKDIYDHYGIDNSDALNEFTQKLLNRVVFLRVCEDRSFEDPEELLRITSYEELRNLFEAADRKYDSGLFAYLDDAPWHVSDYLLVSIFQDLYYPNSSYDFNVVQPHVIGHIYERFLGQRVTIEDGRVSFMDTPEAIESNGVVPTPKDVTDAIVANALDGMDFPCRVADICCGSGNFLLSAYEYLVSKDLAHLAREAGVSDSPVELIQRPSGPDLPYWRKRQTMAEAIYGVDIDPRAVEVAQLSLSLRLLEGCTPEELDEYRSTTGNRLLPDLTANVKCGNSLVGYEYFDYDESAVEDIQALRSVRPFDWQVEFPFGGFDAVIGNPPYIRVQNLAKYTPKEYGFYRSPSCRLKVAKSELLDKYQLFVERGLSLLKEDGRLGMIIPNKFMTTKTGKSLRSVLSKGGHVLKIIDFGTLQVFPGRSTYTCILIASPGKADLFERERITALSDFVSNPLIPGIKYASKSLGDGPWAFPPEALSRHLASIGAKCAKLSEMAEVFVGLQTSKDEAYIFEPSGESDDLFSFTDMLGHTSQVEKELCRPCLLDVSFEEYGYPEPNRQILFPYEFKDDKPVLIPISDIKRRYPHAYSYLVSIKDILDKRAVSPRRKGGDWHKFGRSQSLGKFSGGSHLIWPVLSLGPRYALDRSGKIMFTGGGNGPYYGLELKPGIPESIEYVQAVLSYWLTEALIRSRTSVFRGGYYSHGKQFVSDLPIRRIDFADSRDVELYDRVVALVRRATDLVAKRTASSDRRDAELYGRSLDATKRELESALDALYEVDADLKAAITK